MYRSQNSVETIILISLAIIIAVIIFSMFSGVTNNSGVKYLSTPYELSNLRFFNFVSEQSSCSFDFSYSLNKYEPGNQAQLSFILNNGVKIIPEYNDYSLSVSEVTPGMYSYTYTQVKQTSYNSTVCTAIAQSEDKGYYVKYIEREVSNGKYVIQPSGSYYVFAVNSKNQNPSTLYANNTVYLDASFITNAGIVYIKNENGTPVKNSPFTFGEYIYLPTGNYTISYSNSSNPVNFMYWSSYGGIIISNPFSSTTNVMVLNNGEIFANLRNLLTITKYFHIYSNKTYALQNTKIKISVEPPIQKGFYTFEVNNQPYDGCVHLSGSNPNCTITESAGNYTISAIFENATTYEVSYPIKVTFYAPPYVILTGSYLNGNVTLYANVKGGYGQNTYTFYYSNGTPINGCQNIQSPTCKFQIPQIPVGVKIKIYNPAPYSFAGPNGAQVELQPNLTNLGITSKIGYDRFFEGSTELYSWCEGGCDSDNPSVWVRIPGGIGPNQSVIITLNGSKIVNAVYSVAVKNSAGSVSNSTNVEEINGIQYPYFSDYMGSKSQNNNIAQIMNPGLVYNIYYDSNGTCNSQSYFNQLYSASLISGTIINGCQKFIANSNYLYTIPSGVSTGTDMARSTSSSVSCTNENNVLFNNQTQYACGNGYWGNPTSTYVPNLANSWQLKAIGWAVAPSTTKITMRGDDGIALGYSSYIFDNFENWLGNPTNATNLVNAWFDDNLAQNPPFNSSIPSGTYRIEVSYFEDGGQTYLLLFSNQKINYYSPTPYPNNQQPIITYETNPPITYNPNKNLTFVNNRWVEQTSGFSWMNNPTQQFTISIWVNPGSPSGVIVDELGQPQANTGWHDSWIELVNGNVYIRVWNLGCVNLGSIPLGTWSNIVMVGSVSGSTLTYSGYINGVLKASGTGYRSTPGGSASMYYPLGVGDSTNCGSGAYFNGQMANYQFYNTIVNPTNIYNAGVNGNPPTTSGLKLWYALNGTATDYSGNNNNGKIN